ncbi:MAG TPA: hypothetical protein VG245_11295 [Candidatus Dormibacteraeota bacterium]|nr:hypothetical protein [Candidatus Dormibacteraeota bacterium]
MGVGEAPGKVRLRALELGEYLDETFKVYRARFALFAGLSATLALPSLAVQLATGAYREGGVFNTFVKAVQHSNGGSLTATSSGTTSAVLVLWLVGAVLLPFSTALITGAACRVAIGEPVSFGQAWALTARRYGTFWGIGFFKGAVAVFFCLVFPFYFLILWTVATPAAFIEGAGASPSLARSSQLIKGAWWSTFGRLALLVILVFVAELALGALAGFASFLLPGGDTRLAATAVMTAVATALVAPLSGIAVVLIYLDRRVRKESLDLQVLAAESARGGGPGGGAPGGYPQSGGYPPQPGGYPQPGYPPQPGGYPQPGYPPQPGGYPQPGYPPQPGGYPQPGYPPQPGGYPQPGYPPQPGGYPRPGYPPQPGGYPQPGYPPPPVGPQPGSPEPGGPGPAAPPSGA